MSFEKLTGEKLKNRYEYEFEAWEKTTGFEPVELLAHSDNAGAYEQSSMHVFKLKRGYAIVGEFGCSCYESSDADIDILPDMKSVKESLRNIASNKYDSSGSSLAKDLLLILMGKS